MRILNAKFGWRRNIPPELDLNPGDRRNLRERFAQYQQRFVLKTLPIAAVLVIAFIMWGMDLEQYLARTMVGGWSFPLVLLGFIAGGQAVIAFVLRRDHARLVRTILRELGHDVCVRCGYLLRGLGENVTQCPECGAERASMERNRHAD